jgi:HD superfamily phosphodiesterase
MEMEINKVVAFVKEVCAGRPPSHGLEHMKLVRDRALVIRSRLPINEQPAAYDVALIALLHDVADHKYDHDGQLRAKVLEFLEAGQLHSGTVMACIDAISFSKERALGMRWYTATLEPYWVQIRDIVSDADKLEALGAVGGQRCLEYAEELGFHGREALHHFTVQMRTKLMRLRDEFIVTAPAKLMAVSLHDELVMYYLSKVEAGIL